jgi:ketosteroid isomerase-like protein
MLMASANIDLVRAIYSDWERGDYDSTDWAHPEVEFVIADGPTPASGIGAEEIRKVWGAFLSAWEGFRHRADEYMELDRERVLVLTRFEGRGKTSGLEIGQMPTKSAVLFHVRRGRVTQIVLYFDRERALTDLDLARESGSQRL